MSQKKLYFIIQMKSQSVIKIQRIGAQSLNPFLFVKLKPTRKTELNSCRYQKSLILFSSGNDETLFCKVMTVSFEVGVNIPCPISQTFGFLVQLTKKISFKSSIL